MLRSFRIGKAPEWVIWFFVVAALVWSAIMQIVGRPLQTEAAPSGIVSYELAGDLETAGAILASWNETARLHAALSLGLDYLFMPLYATAIALACFRAADWWRSRQPGLAAVGVALGWAQVAAALLDAVENVALIRLLLGDLAAAWPPLAWWSATIKFALIGAGLLYVLVSSLVALGRRRSHKDGGGQQAGPAS